MTYDPKTYWTKLHRRANLSAVGQSGQPVSMNRWLYATVERTVNRVADAYRLRPETVLDIGAGTGYWMDWWSGRGASVYGVDLDSAAVEALNGRYPDSTQVLDIGETVPDRTGDLVLVMNVLLHITDDARFNTALQNVARAVAPGGYLLMVEPIQTASGYRRQYPPTASSRALPLERYVMPLEEQGLQIAHLGAASAIGSDPIEASSAPAFQLWLLVWRLLKLPGKVWPPAGQIGGRLVYLFDPLLMRRGLAPTSKVLLLKRPV